MRTLLGHLAYRLGGEAAYAKVAEQDRNLRGSSTTQLAELLEAHAPCVILLDETLQYLAILHFGTLLGTGPGNPAGWLLPSAFAAAAAAGLCWGAYLRARRPGVYATIGLGAHAAGQAIAPSGRPLS